VLVDVEPDHAVLLAERGFDLRMVPRDVPEQPDAATGSQCHRCTHRADLRVHPVPRLTGDEQVEPPLARVPLFEPSRFHRETLRAGELGHARIGLDPEDLATARDEERRHDAGAATDVEHVAPPIGEEVEHLVGIAGTGPVVAGGVGPERLRPQPLLVQHGAHHRRARIPRPT